MGTVSKALELLNLFSDATPEMGLIEFAKSSGRDKATVHRYLGELEANGFLEQNPETKRYRLGVAVLRLSAIRERTFPTRALVSERVSILAAKIGELAHASLIQGLQMSPICFRDGGTGSTRVYFSEADMLPLHATSSGLAALAFGPDELLKKVKAKKLESYTKYTAIDQEQLIELVNETKDNGYAYSHQTFEDEVCSVAVPFFETEPHAIGTLAIAVPRVRMDALAVSEIAQLLWQESQIISHELGGTIPAPLKLKLEERKLI